MPRHKCPDARRDLATGICHNSAVNQFAGPRPQVCLPPRRVRPFRLIEDHARREPTRHVTLEPLEGRHGRPSAGASRVSEQHKRRPIVSQPQRPGRHPSRGQYVLLPWRVAIPPQGPEGHHDSNGPKTKHHADPSYADLRNQTQPRLPTFEIGRIGHGVHGSRAKTRRTPVVAFDNKADWMCEEPDTPQNKRTKNPRTAGVLKRGGRDSNPQPPDRQSGTLTN